MKRMRVVYGMGIFLLTACSDGDEATCERTERVCEWNPATQAFDSNCKYSGCATDGGVLDAQALGEGGASTAVPVLKPTALPTNDAVVVALAEPGDVPQGTAVSGWDLCGGAPGLIKNGPRPGSSDPVAVTGSSYLIFGSSQAMSSTTAGNFEQMFFYFPEGKARESEGLWFDVRRLSGEPQDLRLVVTATKVCQAQTLLGTFDLKDVARVGSWTRTCAPLPLGSISTEVGLRLEGAAANGSELSVAFDSFTLGRACP